MNIYDTPNKMLYVVCVKFFYTKLYIAFTCETEQ